MRLRSLRLLALVAFSLSIAACSSTEPVDEEIIETPPAFPVASIVANCGGAQCLQFAATPNDAVTVAVVNIRTPWAKRSS